MPEKTKKQTSTITPKTPVAATNATQPNDSQEKNVRLFTLFSLSTLLSAAGGGVFGVIVDVCFFVFSGM